MPQFFVEEYDETSALITGTDYHHLVDVRRIRQGERIMVRTPEGKGYNGTVVSVTDYGVKVELVEELEEKPRLALDLYISLLKGKSFDTVIQKAVEVGVSRIIPMECTRSIVRVADLSEKKISRWHTIAQEAAKQSMARTIPLVGKPGRLIDLLPGMEGTVLAAHPEGKDFSLLDRGDGEKVSLLVGPEGGFAPEELELFNRNEVPIVSWGATVMRAETAGVVLPALVLYEMERRDGGES
jgi:16S rRNA (uracil1498-N3)-methyltransferase